MDAQEKEMEKRCYRHHGSLLKESNIELSEEEKLSLMGTRPDIRLTQTRAGGMGVIGGQRLGLSGAVNNRK